MFAWIVVHPWAYPALEVLHILGIALLLDNLVLFELRVWGFAAELPVLSDEAAKPGAAPYQPGILVKYSKLPTKAL